MADFNIPSLRKLITDAESDIQGELPGTDATLRRRNLNVLARVMAGFTHGLYGFIRNFLKQCLPWSKGFLLRQWAEIWGIYQEPPVSATGVATFPAADGKGIDFDQRMQSDAGLEYAVVVAGIASGGSVSVQVKAVTAGTAGNLAATSKLTLLTTVEGVTAEGLVGSDGLTGGREQESIDSLWARFLERVQKPAHGGNADDYVTWVKESGVGATKVWVRSGLDGLDTVQVFFICENNADSIIPSPALVAQALAYIQEPSRKPVAASVGVYAPTPKEFTPTIRVVPNTPAVRNAVLLQLNDLINRERDLGGKLLRSHIDEEISLADGETDHTLISPTGDIQCAANEVLVMGTPQWTA
ncbi:baseplate J/gp47 family protein [Herbaspirillum sp.]|uniref:baseplate J/gp47 family protein n=1 Tax=Herbaspirillum sp. TaxID=1890675 RepID=UPI00257FDAE6|nr:baseplate J/gp47 family protein [Herbaspirillum sp.]|tara:strand:- start:982 stop:2049 length:1068 start_codon:yes stop_codon:yes gene_type:complete